MARVSLELGSRGTGSYETLTAIPVEDLLPRCGVKVPRRRLRRSRARARARAGALGAAARAALRARQRRHRRRRAAARVAVDDIDGLVAAAERERVDLRSSGPRRRCRRARRRARGAGVTPLRAERRGGAAGGLEGVRQAGDGGGRACRPRAGRGCARSRRGSPRSRAHEPVARRRGAQGRRPRRRQGRDRRRRRARRRARRSEAFLVEHRFGDRHERGRRGAPVGRGALAAGALRRRARVPMAPAQDYKRIFDGDVGPNTGGMGSYSPVPGFDEARVEELVAAVHQPIVELMRERGTPFHGVLYGGLMLTADGPARDRVQRPLRRPRDAGAAAAAALRPARAAARAPRARAASPGGALEWTTRLGGDRRAGQRRLPGVVLERRRRSAASTRCRRADVEVTHAGTARGRRASSPRAAACSTSPRSAPTRLAPAPPRMLRPR